MHPFFARAVRASALRSPYRNGLHQQYWCSRTLSTNGSSDFTSSIYDTANVSSVVDELATLGDIHRYAVSLFTSHGLSYGHGTSNPWEDASFILMHELHLPHSDPISQWKSCRLLRSEREHLVKMLHRRTNSGQPSPYIVRGCYLQGHHFYVDERVLIPRSYIAELLVSKDYSVMGTSAVQEESHSSSLEDYNDLDYNDYFENYDGGEEIDRIKGQSIDNALTSSAGSQRIIDSDKVLSVLDIGTGSGCLAILAANVFPNVDIIDAIDISKDALDVARINVENHGLSEVVCLFEGNLFDALPSIDSDCDKNSESTADVPIQAHTKKRKYDLIISNPPYVDTESMNDLPVEFLHEPSVALEAGTEGLDVVERILVGAYDYLEDGGGLLCEVGSQKEALERAFPRLFLAKAITNGSDSDSNSDACSSNTTVSARTGQSSGALVRWLTTAQSSNEVFYVPKQYLSQDYLR